VVPPRAVTFIEKLIGVWNSIKTASNSKEKYKFPYKAFLKQEGIY
jgi:hypothetical protein